MKELVIHAWKIPQWCDTCAWNTCQTPVCEQKKGEAPHVATVAL